jgi:peptide deformylase
MLVRQFFIQFRCQKVNSWGRSSSFYTRHTKRDMPFRFINFFSKNSLPQGKPEDLKLAMLGDPILRKRSENISFDSGISSTLQWLTPLSRDMSSLMQAQYGAGLAAPQIGRNVRMFLMDETDPDDSSAPVQVDPAVVINPKILKLEGSWEFDFEGCLSVPLLAALVPRATIAHVTYVDATGTTVSRELRGWTARIFQHEVGQNNQCDTWHHL